MTEDPTPRTDRPAEGGDLPLPGIEAGREIEEAQEHFVDVHADLESNELHAAGRTCARCGRVIQPDEDARNTAEWELPARVLRGQRRSAARVMLRGMRPKIRLWNGEIDHQ